jgi:DNA-binding Lrp family transcriptional regulator
MDFVSTVIETPETKSIKEQMEEHGIDITHKVMAWLGLTVEPMKLKKVAEKLAAYDNVIVAAITSGDHDLVVQLIADNENSLHLFIEKIVKPISGIHPQMDVSISYISGSKYLK